MLTLAQAKAYLRLAAPAPGDTPSDEDQEVAALLAAAVAAFKLESKRRWPIVGEPVLATTDDTTDPPTVTVLGYVDPAVLSADEQLVAGQWVRFTLGHLYENRQTVVVDGRVVAAEVPGTAKALMNLLREPTL